ncbi:bifunctional diaminohydroxyphosphoribosylaminopyrimidine deaminase/5-amino-6-(5-phosphoribosylamino)uracil reductase RibD [Nakamurella sp. A5-74]|uniref:Riboflavin biosynthesis protein RibD n=1 Tax=Nakamurella sp. A5-74 TaxID=3158264 RepID=A0AAU8DTQ7_9ACTN
MTVVPGSGSLPVLDAERSALERAAELAANGIGRTLPNPVVGCVVLGTDGSVVGEGWHERAGGPHAEVNALADAGVRAHGGTAVITLEPCNHTGRTGPCTEALIAAGIERVVVGARDPFEPAAGGVERLIAAGIQVIDVSELAIGAVAAEVNRVWLTSMANRRPFVTLKTGMTVDGRVAAVDGTSRWITSEASRADVHRLRAEVDTMMVGIGTVLADDPRLTVRDPGGLESARQPLRVVVDSTGRTPSGAQLLAGPGDALVATATNYPGPGGRVDLAALMADLFTRGRRHVLLEGGPRLAAAALDARLVDDVVSYLAPIVLGAGPAAVEGGSVATLAEAHRLELRDVTRFGPDVRLSFTVAH